MNADKLAKLQAQVRIGGKGTPRRKLKKTPGSGPSGAGGADNLKVVQALKKIGVQSVGPIEEVNMFQSNGRILNFQQPKVLASINSHMFTVAGHGVEKDMGELMPGILSQLGPEAMNQLRQLAASYQAAAAASKTEGGVENDEEVPELVENFEEIAAEGSN